MRATFQLRYPPQAGHQPMLSLPCPSRDDNTKSHHMRLADHEQGLWQCETEIEPTGEKNVFSYMYLIEIECDEHNLREFGGMRTIATDSDNTQILDTWRDMASPEYALESQAIAGNILRRDADTSLIFNNLQETKSVCVRLRIAAPRIAEGHRLAVTLYNEKVGTWIPRTPLPMATLQPPLWEIELSAGEEKEIRYKYTVIEDDTKVIVFHEEGAPRRITLPRKRTPLIVTDELFRYPQQPWRCAGVAIPLFSLRSRTGGGIGEFRDIRLLVDWARKTGLRVVQLLPLNDTTATHTWHDSYPYSAISVFALHPVYLNINDIGTIKSPVERQIVEQKQEELNKLEQIDYEAVEKLKWRCLGELYRQDKDAFLATPEYRAFYAVHASWLRPYAAFCYLRDLTGTADHRRWGRYAKLTPTLLDELCDPSTAHFDRIAIHYFTQWHAHRQLAQAASYARSKGVALKGDIPIGVSPTSVDTWTLPALFDSESQAGAPPDDFTAAGQNWGFPTYNWRAMAADNHRWWRDRLRHMSLYFDAFRIDHILGFFRIWQIPSCQTEGLMGTFNPSLPFTRDELETRGLHFDHKRLCTPYIREHHLEALFGVFTNEVKSSYLFQESDRCYSLKEHVNTQRKITEALALNDDETPEIRFKQEIIQRGLLWLASEVILLPFGFVNDEPTWTPRHSMHETRSFQELGEAQQRILCELYEDFFYHRNEKLWTQTALDRLPAIKKATRMLLCGEDLGMVPACVPDLMCRLGILSLEVQRMPKATGKSFGLPESYPNLSVATTSTHDTTPLRRWWEEDPKRSQEYYTQILDNKGGSPFYCETWIARQIVEQHLHAPSMLAIFPIQDLLALSEKLRTPDARRERINNPANPHHYWRYRMHISLENLLEEHDFNKEIEELVSESNRDTAYQIIYS